MPSVELVAVQVLVHNELASIPGRSQLRKTAPRILGIEISVSIIIVNDVIAQIIAVLLKQHNIYRYGLD